MASRAAPDDVFSSSPAHPSHARNPFQKPQTRSNTLKRTASVASLPSPPHVATKRVAPFLRALTPDATDDDDDDDGDDESVGVLTEQEDSLAPRPKSSLRRIIIPIRKASSVPDDSSLFSESFAPTRAPRAVSSPPPSTIIRSSSKSDTVVAEAEDVSDAIPGSSVDSKGKAVASAKAAPMTPPPTREHRPRRLFTGPIRDSGNNPFLSSTPHRPRVPTEGPLEERPTIQYVFRGVRTVFANPYAHKKYGPGELDPSTLPETHPDYSPEATVRPRLLWPSPLGGATKTTTKEKGKGRARALSISDDEEREPLPRISLKRSAPGEQPVSRRLFAAELGQKSSAGSSSSAASQHRQVNAVPKRRSPESASDRLAEGAVAPSRADRRMKRLDSYVPKPSAKPKTKVTEPIGAGAKAEAAERLAAVKARAGKPSSNPPVWRG